MKQLIRYFSLGLFTAGVIMLLGIFFTDSNDVDELSAEEMIPFLENEGYHVLDNSEYIALSVKSDENNEEEEKEEKEEKKSTATSKDNDKESKDESKDKEEEKDNDQEKDKDKESSEEPKEQSSYVLNIESGMPTSAICDLLEEQNIIDDASDFNDYLMEHDYSLKVQMGEVEVSKDMSFYELAEAITR